MNADGQPRPHLSWAPFFAGKRQYPGDQFSRMAQNVVGMMFLMAMTDPKFEDKSYYKEPVPLTNALIYPLTSVKVITKAPLNIGGELEEYEGRSGEEGPEEEDAGSQEAARESGEAASQEEEDDGGDGDEASEEEDGDSQEPEKE